MQRIYTYTCTCTYSFKEFKLFLSIFLEYMQIQTQNVFKLYKKYACISNFLCRKSVVFCLTRTEIVTYLHSINWINWTVILFITIPCTCISCYKWNDLISHILQGKSALWSHLLSYLELQDCNYGNQCLDSNKLAPPGRN